MTKTGPGTGYDMCICVLTHLRRRLFTLLHFSFGKLTLSPPPPPQTSIPVGGLSFMPAIDRTKYSQSHLSFNQPPGGSTKPTSTKQIKNVDHIKPGGVSAWTSARRSHRETCSASSTGRSARCERARRPERVRSDTSQGNRGALCLLFC